MYRIPRIRQLQRRMSRIARRGLRTHRARNGRLQQLAGRFPLIPPRKSGSASSTRAPICCCGSTSRNAVRRPARSTTTAPYGPTPARSSFSAPKGATPTTTSNATASARCSSGTGATAHRRNMPPPKCCAPCGDARPIRTLRCRKPKETTAGTLTLAIPAAALFRDRIAGWDGVQGAMNLYKCGDDLSCPHYLSWRPVGTPAPDFHRPEFFEPVFFEPKKQ